MTDALHYLVVAGIFWAVICRARLMSPDTLPRVMLQYRVLLIGAVLSLPIYTSPEVGQLMLGGAVLLYLWLDARRWRYGVPR